MGQWGATTILRHENTQPEKHTNVPNGDEIGIVRPLEHSQQGPTRVLPVFGVENFFLGVRRSSEPFYWPKMPQKRSEAARIIFRTSPEPPPADRLLIGPISRFLSQSKTGPFRSFWVLWVLVPKDPSQAPIHNVIIATCARHTVPKDVQKCCYRITNAQCSLVQYAGFFFFFFFLHTHECCAILL
jgi:hypothetical protein